MHDRNTIILIAGLHGWRVTEFVRLHPDQDIQLVRVCRYLYEEPVECLGMLHELERMSVEEIVEELGKLGRLQWHRLS